MTSDKPLSQIFSVSPPLCKETLAVLRNQCEASLFGCYGNGVGVASPQEPPPHLASIVADIV